MSIYDRDFVLKCRDGSEKHLSDYKGKVLLIVNTATSCGFTPQYADLQKLYEEFSGAGLEILDFPCNQFAEQAKGTDEEIHTFCTGRFGITFPQFAKIEVRGEGADPLFRYLVENTKFGGFSGAMGLVLKPVVRKMDKNYKENGEVKWNFTKFLVSREGEIIARFEPTDDMATVRSRVKEQVELTA